MILEWRDGRFEEFQTIPSAWAYNWHAFQRQRAALPGSRRPPRPAGSTGGTERRYVAAPGAAGACRACVRPLSADGGDDYLLVAGLEEPPVLWRWDGLRFGAVQTLAGLGARELRVLRQDGRTYVVRVNFIEGTPADPRPLLTSQVYEFAGGALAVVAEFPTSGGTDVEVIASRPGETSSSCRTRSRPTCGSPPRPSSTP